MCRRLPKMLERAREAGVAAFAAVAADTAVAAADDQPEPQARFLVERRFDQAAGLVGQPPAGQKQNPFSPSRAATRPSRSDAVNTRTPSIWWNAG